MKDLLYTRASNSGALTAAGAETVFDTGADINYSIGGKAYTKSAVTDGPTPTTDGDGGALSSITANSGCIMVWCLNGDGDFGVFQSEIEALNATGAFIKYPQFPYVDLNTWCPVAYQVLKADATASAITFGVSNWSATGFTNTITDVHVLPRRPQS